MTAPMPIATFAPALKLISPLEVFHASEVYY
jgi:hypothetical protein